MTAGKQWAIQGGVMRTCYPTSESQKTTGDQFTGKKLDDVHLSGTPISLQTDDTTVWADT